MLKKPYNPVQPMTGAQSANPGPRYTEYSPGETLASYIHCFWEISSPTFLEVPFNYQIIPDGCIDIFIDCDTWNGAYLAGTMTAPTNVPLTQYARYFGVRFLPGAINHFFSLPLDGIVGQMIPFRDIWGGAFTEIEEQLFSVKSTKDRIRIVKRFLGQRLSEAKSTLDPRVAKAVQLMCQSKMLPISVEKQVSGRAYVSSRQLRRIFKNSIGITPKKFLRIIRFQRILNLMLKTPKQKWSKIAYDFGYYDQAHFIHEFKSFYGAPPTSLSL